MKSIKIIDSQFGHGESFGTGSLMVGPTNFKWYRGDEDVSDIVFFTESGMEQVNKYPNKINIGIILEPRCISPNPYLYVLDRNIQEKFYIILTHDNDLINSNPNKFKFYPFGGSWIFPGDQQIYKKSNNISIIASDKNYTEGHRLRHSVIKKNKKHINGIFGRGYNLLDNKLLGLKEYRFSIIIENDKKSNLFTEKLIDCFLTGTIPIYWGCPNIDEFFNPFGIMIFNDIEELEEILIDCNISKYNSMIIHILENFELAKKYKIPEDFIWNKYINLI